MLDKKLQELKDSMAEDLFERIKAIPKDSNPQNVGSAVELSRVLATILNTP